MTPQIFDILDNLQPGYGGEIQLTDGLKKLCRQSNMVAVDFEGRRYDTGNPVGFLEATLDYSMRNPETSEFLRQYIQNAAQSMSLKDAMEV